MFNKDFLLETGWHELIRFLGASAESETGKGEIERDCPPPPPRPQNTSLTTTLTVAKCGGVRFSLLGDRVSGLQRDPKQPLERFSGELDS